MGEWTQEDEITYRIEKIGHRPMEYDEFSHMGVVFEMDLDMYSYDRRVYTILELFANVGGLVGAMFAGIRVMTILF